MTTRRKTVSKRTQNRLEQALHATLPGMPTEEMNLWRLVKQIQGWANTVQFETYEALRGRRRLDLVRQHQVGRRIDRATDLIFEKLNTVRKEVDCDL